jgi:hypothetical protein
MFVCSPKLFARSARSQSLFVRILSKVERFKATAMANGSGDTRAFDEERAHRDFDASLEAARAACQAAILINGGAATALLAYLAGKAGVPGAPGAVIRAACLAFLCYAGGVFLGALSMWYSARAGALFAWAGRDKLMGVTGTYDEARYEAQRRARWAWFLPWDQRKRDAWIQGWTTMFKEPTVRPAWFKVIFDQSSLASNLEYARGHLSLQGGAFIASIFLFLGATTGMAISMYSGLGKG